MRFGFAVVMATIFGTGLASPIVMKERSLVTEVGSLVGQLTNGLGVDKVEAQLDHILGGTLHKLEDVLGVSFATKLLDISKQGAAPGTIQAIGEAVGLLLQGLGINTVNAYLNAATGGVVSNLEHVLGVHDLEKALGISQY